MLQDDGYTIFATGVNCSIPGLNNSVSNTSAAFYEDVVRYSCIAGYSYTPTDAADKHRSARCMANGSLESVEGTCSREYFNQPQTFSYCVNVLGWSRRDLIGDRMFGHF